MWSIILMPLRARIDKSHGTFVGKNKFHVNAIESSKNRGVCEASWGRGSETPSSSTRGRQILLSSHAMVYISCTYIYFYTLNYVLFG